MPIARIDITGPESAAYKRALMAADPGIEPSEVSIALHCMTRVDLDVLPGEASSS